jgi:hypothetical protein
MRGCVRKNACTAPGRSPGYALPSTAIASSNTRRLGPVQAIERGVREKGCTAPGRSPGYRTVITAGRAADLRSPGSARGTDPYRVA